MDKETFVKDITPQSEDFSQWYIDTILKADLVDYAPVKGLMVMKPYGYAIWERMQAGLDRRIKATGHQNVYFPLLIPESLLNKEAEHIEGFAPEVAWVTHGGGELLSERLAIRPTSEAIVGTMLSKWIHSYRDLPVLINQWANVVRWEKATRPFLRTTEFLWQEGHTAHQTAEEAQEETLRMLGVYRDFIENDLAIPVVAGRKSEYEKFAGAEATYSLEALMKDGKALQAATSHNLGQHFAKVYDIQYLDKDGQLKYVFQTSWGSSTRMIGGLIMVHGDDRGLVLPPKLAPIQVVLVPIAPQKDRESVLTRIRQLVNQLQDTFRVHLDDRDEHTPGWKFNEWEMRGVPLRLELGPRDVKSGQVVLVRRDTGEKIVVEQDRLIPAIGELLGNIQDFLFEQAKQRLNDSGPIVKTVAELATRLEEKRAMYGAHWCGAAQCEKVVKEKTGATSRNMPFDQREAGLCLVCQNRAAHFVYFARAY